MRLGTLLLGGLAVGGIIGAGVYSWTPAPTAGFEETPQLARARQTVVARPDDPEGWIRLGDEASHVGDHTTARLAYERVIDLAPLDPRGHARLGILLVDVGLVDDARRHLGRAADLGSDDARFVLSGMPRAVDDAPVR